MHVGKSRRVEGETLQEREQKWKGSWRILSQVKQTLVEAPCLHGRDCGR